MGDTKKSGTTLADLDDIMRQQGRTPHVWDLRDGDVWVRHIASGGIDDPVYEYRRVGPIDEVEQMLKGDITHG